MPTLRPKIYKIKNTIQLPRWYTAKRHHLWARLIQTAIKKSQYYEYIRSGSLLISGIIDIMVKKSQFTPTLGHALKGNNRTLCMFCFWEYSKFQNQISN